MADIDRTPVRDGAFSGCIDRRTLLLGATGAVAAAGFAAPVGAAGDAISVDGCPALIRDTTLSSLKGLNKASTKRRSAKIASSTPASALISRTSMVMGMPITSSVRRRPLAEMRLLQGVRKGPAVRNARIGGAGHDIDACALR